MCRIQMKNDSNCIDIAYVFFFIFFFFSGKEDMPKNADKMPEHKSYIEYEIENINE